MFNVSTKRVDKGMYWERAWSLVEGCSYVSVGCKNCWSAAQTHMRSFQKNVKIRNKYLDLTDEFGKWTGRTFYSDKKLKLPLTIKKPTVFAIWNDLFHESVRFDFIQKCYNIMSQNLNHTYLILTKRPERILEFNQWQAGADDISIAHWQRNVWIGTSIEDQKTADERIPVLLKIPTANRFLSIEPCLEYINLDKYLWNKYDCTPTTDINWVIIGAESGKDKRGCEIENIINIVQECRYVDIPVFVKQIHKKGWLACINKLVKDINQFPEEVRYREFPNHVVAVNKKESEGE